MKPFHLQEGKTQEKISTSIFWSDDRKWINVKNYSEGVSFEWQQPGIFSTTTHVPIYIIYFCNARVEDCDGS